MQETAAKGSGGKITSSSLAVGAMALGRAEWWQAASELRIYKEKRRRERELPIKATVRPTEGSRPEPERDGRQQSGHPSANPSWASRGFQRMGTSTKKRLTGGPTHRGRLS